MKPKKAGLGERCLPCRGVLEGATADECRANVIEAAQGCLETYLSMAIDKMRTKDQTLANEIGGPCAAVRHYMLPAMVRLPQDVSLINKEQYFVVHAQRQCGKTTAFFSLANEGLKG